MMHAAPSFFQRFLLPGFAFKAVVIGGGYATGRELAEFFLPCGLRGGLFGMLISMILWSVVCAVTFLFARATKSQDYRSFFRHLLGRGWFVFEIAYFLLLMLILSVFGAAAGAIGEALVGAPPLVGTLCLAGAIALVTAYGSNAVEGLFKYVSFFLYAVYVVFLALALTRFGNRILANFAAPSMGGWMSAGIAYAGYNVVGATAILPVVRHMTSQRDAIVAGLLCGPLAMAPAILLFISIAAFYPTIGAAILPSNFLLERMNVPVFKVIFQLMVFAALLESGAGCVHAVNQRVAAINVARARPFPRSLRLIVSLTLLLTSIFIANRFGLVTLIGRGYRALTVLFLIVFVLPLLTLGVWRLFYRVGKSNCPSESVT
jgi:uncharacterized membrane protein YkvI